MHIVVPFLFNYAFLTRKVHGSIHIFPDKVTFPKQHKYQLGYKTLIKYIDIGLLQFFKLLYFSFKLQ